MNFNMNICDIFFFNKTIFLIFDFIKFLISFIIYKYLQIILNIYQSVDTQLYIICNIIFFIIFGNSTSRQWQ